ncbi:MAG: hypothetical protein QJR00_00065 [Bacillota bacterium]|nr:hypothetical protein [Bacillota bacterium]
MRRLFFLLMLLAGVVLLALILVRPVEEYRAETWALWPESQGPPATFTVDENGRVVVVPRSGDRFYKLSPSRGRWQEVTLKTADGFSPWVAHLTSDGAGGFFAVDQGGSLLWRIGPDGTTLLYFQAPSQGEKWLIQGVAVDPKGQAFLDMVRLLPQAYAREIVRLEENPKEFTVVARVLLDEEGWHLEGESQEAPPGTLSLSPTGQIFFLDPKESDMSLSIRVLAPGKKPGTIRVDSLDRLGRVEVVGNDDRGYVYIGLNLGSQDGSILKVSPEGKAIWALPLPMAPDHPALQRYAQVDGRGNLYVMRPGEGGFEIRFYRLVKRYAWRWMERTGS